MTSGRPKGGLRPGSRPGGKDLLGKNHEAASIFMDQAGPRNCEFLIAECGLKKKTLKSEIRNWKSEIGGPMLFAQKLLAPGPQPKHLGNFNPATGGTPGRAGALPK